MRISIYIRCIGSIPIKASVPKAKAGVEVNPYAAVASVAYPVED